LSQESAIVAGGADLEPALGVLKQLLPEAPDVAIVLGSGLGAFAASLADATRVPYSQIPGMPEPAVAGHAGNLCFGRIGNARVACLSGRVHLYEGHAIEKVVFGVRLLAALGCRGALLTNAAGGIAEALAPGDLMLITDHINLTGRNPLVGPNDPRGPRFLDLTHAYSPEYLRAARNAARTSGTELREGVYAAMLGPSYETPAEIRMLATLGASAVGMSTVPEVIALRHAGLHVGAVSCITNLAAGRSNTTLDHSEVEAVARAARLRFTHFLEHWILAIGAEVTS
jgi:purine-nucleoside phosphorylase